MILSTKQDSQGVVVQLILVIYKVENNILVFSKWCFKIYSWPWNNMGLSYAGPLICCLYAEFLDKYCKCIFPSLWNL